MVWFSDAAKRTGSQLETAGSDIWGGVKSAFKPRDASATVEVVAKEPGFLMRNFVHRPAKAGWYVASRPLAWGTQFVGYAGSKFGSAFQHSPRLALGATAVVGAVGIGSVMNKRAHRRAENQMMNLEAQAALMQAQAQPAYGLQPGEYAALTEPHLKQNGQVNVATRPGPGGPPL